MAENRSIDSQPENLTFWFRRVTPGLLTRIRDCHKKGAFLPEARPGLSKVIAALLARETSMAPAAVRTSGGVGQKGADRLAALDLMNRKVSFLLALVYPPESVLVRAPVKLDPGGRGGAVWLKNPPFSENDVLELRFMVGPGLPWSFHGLSRIIRIGPAGGKGGKRVDFRFETVSEYNANLDDTPADPLVIEPSWESSASPSEPEEIPLEPLEVGTLASPSLLVQPEPALPQLEKAMVTKKDLAVKDKVLEPKVQESSVSKVDADDKYERMLQEGLKLAKVDVADAVVHKGDDPFLMSRSRSADERRDFRINDRIPFVWCHVSEESFQEAMVTFHKSKEFGLRTIIRNQQQILRNLGDIQDVLKRKRSNARKFVEWHRDRLSWLFLRATTENEELYYQGMTELFVAIASDIAKQLGSAGQWSNQALSMMRHMMELLQIRDQANPVTEMDALNRANEGLMDVDRQLPKVLAKVEESNPALAEKLKMYQEALTTVDLSQNDRPVGTSPDGKDLYTVNLSATGIAFRTRRLWVKKGDILEMRVFLSIGGDHFEPVTTYGRVVFVQGPIDGRLKVATYIDPKPATFEQKIYLHVARKQRELLNERAATREEDDF
ncbi:MAG: PilZ domain-containing protein [Magnetococcales bacterium]|nr:PilZ domain-containing protein [Magnetococcales bacterium]